jgi:hypothetical protein
VLPAPLSATVLDEEELQEVNKPNEDKIAIAQTAVLQVFSQSIEPPSDTGFVE